MPLNEIQCHTCGRSRHFGRILTNGGQANVVRIETIVVADERDVAGDGEPVALQLEKQRQGDAILLACDSRRHLRQTHQLRDHVADLIVSVMIDLADHDLRFDAFLAGQQSQKTLKRLFTEKDRETPRSVLI